MRFFEILFEDIWSDIATNWSDKENIPLDQVESYINKYKQHLFVDFLSFNPNPT